MTETSFPLAHGRNEVDVRLSVPIIDSRASPGEFGDFYAIGIIFLPSSDRNVHEGHLAKLVELSGDFLPLPKFLLGFLEELGRGFLEGSFVLKAERDFSTACGLVAKRS